METPIAEPISYTKLVSAAYAAHAFHNIYKPPGIKVGFDGAPITFDDFIEEAIITNSGPGANNIRYLIGPVGAGKSTLVSHILVKYGARLLSEHRLIPIRVGIEEKFENIQATEQRILELIHAAALDVTRYLGLIQQSTYDQLLKNTSINPQTDDVPTCELRLKSLLSHLTHHIKARFVFFIDNLDYIYHVYDRGQFVKLAITNKAPTENQISAMKDRQRAHDIIRYIMRIFRDDSPLGEVGVTAVVVARIDSVQHYIRRAYPHVPIPGDIVLRTYSISVAAINDVLLTYGTLLDRLIDLIPEEGQRKRFKETCTQLELTAIRSGEKDVRARLNLDLQHLSRQGLRQIVEHYKQFVWTPVIIDEKEAIISRFQEQYTPSLIAFLTNGHRLFQQFVSEFPNLYLIRSDSLDENLPVWAESLTAPHRHTYWLKRLILEYIAHEERRNAQVTPRRIFSLFCQGDNKCYEDSIVRLCLGSLAQCDRSYVIEFQFIPGELDHAADTVESIRLTRRGRRLIEITPGISGPNDPFCDTFTYLQLIVDDHMLPIPSSLADVFSYDGQDYGYLVRGEDYHAHLERMMQKKIFQVFCLIDLLALSLEQERRYFSTVFNRFVSFGIQIPDVKKIESRIRHDLKVILQYFPNINLDDYEQARSEAKARTAANVQWIYQQGRR